MRNTLQYIQTSCYDTDSQRPHRWRSLWMWLRISTVYVCKSGHDQVLHPSQKKSTRWHREICLPVIMTVEPWRVHSPNGISVDSAVFSGLVTNRHTHVHVEWAVADTEKDTQTDNARCMWNNIYGILRYISTLLLLYLVASKYTQHSTNIQKNKKTTEAGCHGGTKTYQCWLPLQLNDTIQVHKFTKRVK